jgi:hypothetical protein
VAQQTKSESSGSAGGRSNRRAPSRASSAAKSRSGTRRSQNVRRSSREARARASSQRKKSSSSNDEGTVEAVKDATVKGANTAGSAVASAAKKLKTPAIAAGTGLAGIGTGIALARRKNKKVLGVSLPSRSATRATRKNLADAARNIGALAERTGKVAEQVRVASEAIGEDSGPRKSKSAIEVVLEGLTSRSQSRAG